MKTTWSPGRARSQMDQILEDFQGTLLCDGYAAYEAYTRQRDITLAQGAVLDSQPTLLLAGTGGRARDHPAGTK